MVETMVDVQNTSSKYTGEVVASGLVFSGILVLVGAVGIKRKLTNN